MPPDRVAPVDYRNALFRGCYDQLPSPLQKAAVQHCHRGTVHSVDEAGMHARTSGSIATLSGTTRDPPVCGPVQHATDTAAARREDTSASLVRPRKATTARPDRRRLVRCPVVNVVSQVFSTRCRTTRRNRAGRDRVRGVYHGQGCALRHRFLTRGVSIRYLQSIVGNGSKPPLEESKYRMDKR